MSVRSMRSMRSEGFVRSAGVRKTLMKKTFVRSVKSVRSEGSVRSARSKKTLASGSWPQLYL